jgi:hypothetical protein
MIVLDNKFLDYGKIETKSAYARPMKIKNFVLGDYWIEPVHKWKNRDETAKADKRMSYYSMWFRFLRLAMDCEEQGIAIYAKKNPIFIRIDRSKYEGWGLDTAISREKINFDDWWRFRSHLFEDVGQVSKIHSGSDLDLSSDRYLHLKIDRTQKRKKILENIREILKEHEAKSPLSKKTAFSHFPITGRMRYRSATNRYNALLLKLCGWGNKEILESGYVRPTDWLHSLNEQDYQALPKEEREAMKSDPKKQTERGQRVYKGAQENPSNTIAQIIKPAKRMLFSVCDGFFPTNPNTDYGLL